ncbi:hypothetical protein [Chromatium okenii]|jgi:hypothetical protein|uniref:Uncharacterized protein n=1 Tax=Chromatium okenii TaxID=61644 RepID=A0A2S7XT66_9GAMM|nr:hypothetical protein [Chromatium okenii]MBV5308902.1 hypothetical protein [Chromatium okenii]PQJ96927.1 hypothetical protein CXB77_05035 [Chromatium okenii]
MKEFLLLVFLFGLSSVVHAGLKCSDVTYGNENYHEKMEELAKIARLPDGYYSRYHEDFISRLCNGKNQDLDRLIDDGYIDAKEAQSIARVLGKKYKPKSRTELGKSYGYSREKFSDMGLCNACADNVAQYYTEKPNSKCGKLAKQALEGNPTSIEKLQSFPSYCTGK